MSAVVARRTKAEEMVKRAFGDNVDLTPGTGGHAMVKFIELELETFDEQRAKIMALVESMSIR